MIFIYLFIFITTEQNCKVLFNTIKLHFLQRKKILKIGLQINISELTIGNPNIIRSVSPITIQFTDPVHKRNR